MCPKKNINKKISALLMGWTRSQSSLFHIDQTLYSLPTCNHDHHHHRSSYTTPTAGRTYWALTAKISCSSRNQRSFPSLPALTNSEPRHVIAQHYGNEEFCKLIHGAATAQKNRTNKFLHIGFRFSVLFVVFLFKQFFFFTSLLVVWFPLGTACMMPRFAVFFEFFIFN